jgi:uncharacterized membrane protein (DUF4010 family)
LIGLLTFVIYRLMPSHAIDPWHLLEPREAWAIVVVIAGLGFFNYIMLRLFGTRGVYYAAFLGGLVNSTAAAAELSGAFSTLEDEAIPPAALLLTSAAMFIRNLAILAIFATAAVPGALPALGGMALVTIPFVWWGWRTDKLIGGSLRLASPLSLVRVLKFAALFVLMSGAGALASAIWAMLDSWPSAFSAVSSAAPARPQLLLLLPQMELCHHRSERLRPSSPQS